MLRISNESEPDSSSPVDEEHRFSRKKDYEKLNNIQPTSERVDWTITVLTYVVVIYDPSMKNLPKRLYLRLGNEFEPVL